MPMMSTRQYSAVRIGSGCTEGDVTVFQTYTVTTQTAAEQCQDLWVVGIPVSVLSSKCGFTVASDVVINGTLSLIHI